MNPIQALGELNLWISLLVLFVAVRGWRQYFLDVTRQELFELRDRWFDYAAAGNVGFDHPAYGLLRVSFNRVIRYLHSASLLRIAFLLIFRKDLDTSRDRYLEKMRQAENSLPEDARRAFRQYHADELATLGKHMLRLSLLPTGWPVLIFILIAPVVNQVKQRSSGERAEQMIEIQAIAVAEETKAARSGNLVTV